MCTTSLNVLQRFWLGNVAFDKPINFQIKTKQNKQKTNFGKAINKLCFLAVVG